MRLLSKNDIHQAKSLERKKEVEEGQLLIDKITTLREIRLTEQKNLNEWRDVSMVAISNAVSIEVEKSAQLKEQNKRLEEERKALMQPVYLTKAWEMIKKEQKSIAEDTLNILKRERAMYSLEKEYKSNAKSLTTEQAKLNTDKSNVETLLKDIKTKHTEAVSLRNEAEKLNIISKKHEKSKSIEIRNRERDVAGRERDVKIEYAHLLLKKQELLDIQKHIQSQQAILRNAYNDKR